jgi:hypothetical protein
MGAFLYHRKRWTSCRGGWVLDELWALVALSIPPAKTQAQGGAMCHRTSRSLSLSLLINQWWSLSR